MKNRNFHIFTGDPGSGKSTVLEILKNKGYLTVNEAAREIIKNQVRTGGEEFSQIFKSDAFAVNR